MYDLNQKFFKLTLNTFRASIQNNPDLIPMFDALCERSNATNQLSNVDLFELATNYQPLKYPGYIKKETKSGKSPQKVNSNKKDLPLSSVVNANQNTRQNASPNSDLQSKKSNKNSYQKDHVPLTNVNSSPKMISNTYLKLFLKAKQLF